MSNHSKNKDPKEQLADDERVKSLFGRLAPKKNYKPLEWQKIREQAREELFINNTKKDD